jgi:hypothetical protein
MYTQMDFKAYENYFYKKMTGNVKRENGRKIREMEK